MAGRNIFEVLHELSSTHENDVVAAAPPTDRADLQQCRGVSKAFLRRMQVDFRALGRGNLDSGQGLLLLTVLLLR